MLTEPHVVADALHKCLVIMRLGKLQNESEGVAVACHGVWTYTTLLNQDALCL